MNREQLINEAVAKALGWKMTWTGSIDAGTLTTWVSSDRKVKVDWFYGATEDYDDALNQDPLFMYSRDMIGKYLFPHIEKLGLRFKFADALMCLVPAEEARAATITQLILNGFPVDVDSIGLNMGVYLMMAATPLQICEAFLRATGNWTKEMEA